MPTEFGPGAGTLAAEASRRTGRDARRRSRAARPSDPGGLQLRQLEYFLAVAAEQSFTRAATRLHVVQSAVSAAISGLERELGATLFDRSAQGVVLTAAGEALLPKARTTLDTAHAARDAVQRAGRELGGSIAIGCLSGVGGIDFAGLLGRFHTRHPLVRLWLRTAESDGSAGLARSLADGELDVAFLGIGARPFPQLHTRRLLRLPQVLAVPATHPLASRNTVTLTEVAGERFIDYPVGYATRTATDQAFAAAGLERTIAMEVSDVAVAADFVAHGLGVAFLPARALPAGTGIKALPLDDQSLEWSLHVATARHRRVGAATAALLKLVDEHLEPAAWRTARHGKARPGSRIG
ncbi:LysR family transcriptional regulator [Micromonospora musae]|uniref:LysR family transcriptional regulator n=1 Tax=Micromonospora musae TaxID=1894970 RepID=UPI0018F57399|nr:LysR family transcriptional regulator [Micromonospora musae]